MINRFILILVLIVISLPASSITIATYNIRNYDAESRPKPLTDNLELLKIINGIAPDVIGAQEIVNDSAFRAFISDKLPGFDVVISEYGGMGNQKLAFAYNSKNIILENTIENETLCMSAGCVNGLRPAFVGHFRIKASNIPFSIINLHLKAGGESPQEMIRQQQFQLITRMIQELRRSGKNNLILLGDFNTTNYLENNSANQVFLKFVDQNSLYDFSSEIACSSYWGAANGKLNPSILDHVLIDKKFKTTLDNPKATVHAHCQKVRCQKSTAIELGNTFIKVSDHCPISAKL